MGTNCFPLVADLSLFCYERDFMLALQRIINLVLLKLSILLNINVMRQTACMVVNPIKVNSFAYLFNCTTVGRTSD